jgi:hypothetical protein
VLARDFALRRLEPELEDIDELVLLGDVFDFLFSTVELAFAQAEPFFELLARTLRGKRLTFLAGNHDHHIALRTLRAAVELKVATGAEGEELERAFAGEYLSFFQRFMDRRLAGVDCRIVYPTHRIGDVLLTHGHYLDAHREGSLPNRLLARATLAVGGVRGEEELRVEDYEAAIVPLTELLFTVAQLPRGCTVQRSFERQFGRIARVLRLGALAEAGARRLAGRRNGQRPGRRHTAGAPATPRSPRRPRSPPSERSRATSAGMGGRRRSSSPTRTSRLRRPPPPACSGTRFWNTGSWIYEPSLRSYDSYRDYLARAWPGTAVLIDSERQEPELLALLGDQNPLAGGDPRPGAMLSAQPDMLRARAERFAARARDEGRSRMDQPAAARARRPALRRRAGRRPERANRPSPTSATPSATSIKSVEPVA